MADDCTGGYQGGTLRGHSSDESEEEEDGYEGGSLVGRSDDESSDDETSGYSGGCVYQ